MNEKVSLDVLKQTLQKRPKSAELLRKAHAGKIRGTGRADYCSSHEAMYIFRDRIETFLDDFVWKFEAFKQSELKKKAVLLQQIKNKRPSKIFLTRGTGIDETGLEKLIDSISQWEKYHDNILALLDSPPSNEFVVLQRKPLEEWLKAEEKLPSENQSIAENVLKKILGIEP